MPKDAKFYNTKKQDHALDSALDFKIISQAHPALFRKEKTVLESKIINRNRLIWILIK